jgi:gas vesicle protein
MKTDKVILGVLGGLAAGAIMGILFAPEKEKNKKEN